jgi:hypothetical protein
MDEDRVAVPEVMRLRRVTGLALVVLAVLIPVAMSLSDPAVEDHDDRRMFVQQVENAADRVPVIYVFQVIDVARGLLTAAAGVGLYMLLRRRTIGLGLVGLVMALMSGVFAAATAFVGAGMTTAAQDYVAGRLDGIGTGSLELLEMIRVLAIVHFASFMTALSALGLGILAFSRALAWSTATIPKWLGRAGLVAGTLLCLPWLTFINELLFIPFFVGIVAGMIWLFIAGIKLLRTAEPATEAAEA